MNEHYFSGQPQSKSNEQTIHSMIAGQSLTFHTDHGVFSRGQVDYGSRVLIETVLRELPTPPQRFVELGSGYGPIVLSLLKAWPHTQGVGVEINERAYQLAQANGRENRIDRCEWVLADATAYQTSESVDLVVTNPPIRAGKAVIQQFIDRAYDILAPGGTIWVVIQKKQGAPSMQTYMETVFGNVIRVHRDKGYWILMSNKESI